MKKILLLAFSILLLASSMVVFNSCGKDDPAPVVMVVAERNTGKLFIVDKTTAAKTEVGIIEGPEAPLTNIRGMVYSKSAKAIYASRTDDGGGSFFKINPKTRAATLLNGNPDGHWYGVADLLLTSDNKPMGILWFQSDAPVGYGPGFLTLNTDGGVSNQVIFSNENICCGMGMVYGASSSEIYIASYGLEIYKSDLAGTTELYKTLTPQGFDSEDIYNFYVQNMVKDSKGKIYATVYGYDEGNTYLAEVDLKNELLKYIGQLNVDNTNRYHGLMLLSKDLL
jgi:hypothetical protein